MDTGHTANSRIATLAWRRGPIAAIRRANSFALIAKDEGGDDPARPHRDQGSPRPGSALLARISHTHAARSIKARTMTVQSMTVQSMTVQSVTVRQMTARSMTMPHMTVHSA
jgi:hypothetical protein